jgi:hypothetical protein
VSWRTTLVAPVSRETPALVTVACAWCAWVEGPFDAAREDGRAQVCAARVTHVCTARTHAPAETSERD